MNIIRKTFLIDKSGRIKHIFYKPKVEVHAEEVLDNGQEI